MKSAPFKIIASNLAVGLLTLAVSATALAQKAYRITDLGVLRGGSARVHGLNSRGQVVGGSGFVYGSDRHAFLWQGQGGMNDLRLQNGQISEAFGINDAGVVVGTVNAATTTAAFRWSSSGGMRMLPLLPGTNASVAYAINASGESVGRCGNHAVLWTGDSVVELAGLPGGSWSESHGLNNRGQIAGFSSSGEGTRAVLWSGGRIRNLGVLPGDLSSRANTINDVGTVVGASEGRTGVHAFMWTPAGGMEALETPEGGNYSEAFGINSAGQIVGSSGSSVGTRAVIWSKSTGLVDLNTLVEGAPPTLVLTGAVAINETGEIVAFGVDEPELSKSLEVRDDRNMHHAGTKVFLLSPQ